MPNPYYDGPLMPTWDIPGYYGGWTTGPVLCDPVTVTCRGSPRRPDRDTTGAGTDRSLPSHAHRPGNLIPADQRRLS